MLIDTHLHESKYSGDSFITLEEIVYRSMEMGLHGVCITDHESNKIKKEAEVLMKETGFLIITGAEILTFEGDMTIFGLERLPGKKIHAQELTDIVDKAGGVAVCSHPYRQNNRGMGDHIRQLNLLWGIEALNGSTPWHHNNKAFELAIELGVSALGGSDAHHMQQIGKFATKMPDWVKDERSFIKAVKEGYTIPVEYKEGIYEVVDCCRSRKAV